MQLVDLCSGSADRGMVGALHHAERHLAEVDDFHTGAIEGDRRLFEVEIVEIDWFPGTLSQLGFRWHDLGHQPGERAGEPDENQGIADVEQGVCVRDLSRCLQREPGGLGDLGIVRGDGAHGVGKLRNDADPQRDPGEVEDDVGDRRLQGLARAPDPGDQRGDAGADIRAEDQCDPGLQWEQSLGGHHDDDPGGR